MITVGWDGMLYYWNMSDNSIIFSFDNDRVRYHIATLTHDEKIVAASDYDEGL